jgi:hypothetical protein
MQWLTSLLLSILLLAVPAVGMAADSAVPPPDPAGVWRVMTHDNATTTSACIGQIKTIGCSIDTHWACWVRGDRRLCDMAWDPVWGESFHPQPKGRAVYDIYRIEGAVRYERGEPIATVAKLTHNLDVQFGKNSMRKNDIAVAVYFNSCLDPDRADCIAETERQIREYDAPPTIFVFRYTAGKGWRITSYDTPRW